MNFRDREKDRQLLAARELFSSEALASQGTYGKIAYPFCLADPCSGENLWKGFRTEALAYFDARAIGWHGGFKRPGEDGTDRRFPSGHLCDSQSFCVNVWWPFAAEPQRLASVLRGLGYSAAEVLPFVLDPSAPFVAFEWIGQRNYLGEGPGGNATPDERRTRGKNATSADAALRFRRQDGQIQILLVEWKYTEFYASKSIQVSDSGTDRLATYAPHLRRGDSLFKNLLTDAESLFFDPFDQLMRLQLLAAAMEREHEMDADVVSVLHLAPRANRQLLEGITSPNLRPLGSNIHEVWRQIVGESRFAARYVDEDVLPLVVREAPDRSWAEWLMRRYGDMK
jgi:hypothetical protein